MNGPFLGVGESADGFFRWELTDTFGGEANYSWVKRGLVRVAQEPDESWTREDKDALQRRILRAARKAAGISGVRSRRSDTGDYVRYDQGGTVLFVEFGECWIAGTPDEVAAAKAEAVEA